MSVVAVMQAADFRNGDDSSDPARLDWARVRAILTERVVAIDERKVMLKDGHAIEADLVVIGIGVKPLIDLAERAGIKTDKGVSVNEYLETSIPQIFAAGDIALARSANRRPYSRRALCGGRTPGTVGGAEHTWPARQVRCSAVLLDDPVRFHA